MRVIEALCRIIEECLKVIQNEEQKRQIAEEFEEAIGELRIG